MCISMHYEIIFKEIGVFSPARVQNFAYLTNYHYLCIVLEKGPSPTPLKGRELS